MAHHTPYYRLLLSVALLCLFFMEPSSAQAPPAPTGTPGQLRIGGFAKSLNYLVAEKQGFFTQEGISPCFSFVSDFHLRGTSFPLPADSLQCCLR